MIKGLIFDFDGLILDTESPEYETWSKIFADYGCHFSLEEWQISLGTHIKDWDPAATLEERLGREIDKPGIRAEQKQRFHESILQKTPLPGIPETLENAKARGLKLGVASSGNLNWVQGNLKRLDLFDMFDRIVCRDHVQKVKPDPELFLRCAQELGIMPSEAIVFEDSHNGILASKAAGIFCVAVPNIVSGTPGLQTADLVLKQINAISLDELLKIAAGQS